MFLLRNLGIIEVVKAFVKGNFIRFNSNSILLKKFFWFDFYLICFKIEI